jgi:4'-phosphopantetheinyl transferase EntD
MLYRGNTKLKVFLCITSSLDNVRKTDFLHNTERKYYNSIKNHNRKKEYLLGRLASKNAVGMYLKEKNHKNIEIDKAVLKYPIVKYPTIDVPELTISHQSGIACAVAYPQGHNMGIDIEPVRTDKKDVYSRILTTNEKRFPRQMNLKKTEGQCLLWTMKEAVSKALHCGFTVPYKVLEVEKVKSLPDGSFESYYKNLNQYKALSVLHNELAFSIVMPFKTKLKRPLKELIETIN